MGSRRKSGQAPARGGSSSDQPKELTWREDKFVYEYVRQKGNGTQAAIAAGYKGLHPAEAAYELLRKPHIVAAIEREKDRVREMLKISIDDVARVLVGQAFTTVDDIKAVVNNPLDPESYDGLGDKKYAIELVPTGKDGRMRAKLPSAGERRAALNDLREILGLGTKPDSGAGKTALDDLFEALGKLQRSGTEGT